MVASQSTYETLASKRRHKPSLQHSIMLLFLRRRPTFLTSKVSGRVTERELQLHALAPYQTSNWCHINHCSHYNITLLGNTHRTNATEQNLLHCSIPQSICIGKRLSTEGHSPQSQGKRSGIIQMWKGRGCVQCEHPSIL